jgi:hypothetical protein
MAEFVRFARFGGHTDTSPVAAREAVAVGCAGAQSLRNGGQPVRVEPLSANLVEYFERGQLGPAS